MKKILVMCNVDPNTSPRPNRMIHWLKGEYEITVLSRSEVRVPGIKSHVYNPYLLEGAIVRKAGIVSAILRNIRGGILRAPSRLILNFLNILLGRYEEANWLKLAGARALVPEIKKEQFDLIISHDLVLLPLAFQVGGDSAKVIFDAREYHPGNFDDNWFWRFSQKPVIEYLCAAYLPRCNKVITVSPGIADEYRREFGIEAEVVMSLPSLHDLQPAPLQAGRVRMIHHGNANTSRRTELMLEMMDHVDERFTLDLMMVLTDAVYWNKIVGMAEHRRNVRIILPVPMQEIVSTINQYDIGLYLAFPSNFNIERMLPNKLFEFIQARLAVAIGPSIEMKKIVEKYACGIVSQDFSPESLAHELNKLTDERIMHLKWNSHRAARELNAEVTGRRIREMVREAIGF
jgi:hypothetical protein